MVLVLALVLPARTSALTSRGQHDMNSTPQRPLSQSRKTRVRRFQGCNWSSLPQPWLSFHDAFMESRIKQQATSNRTFSTRAFFSTFPQLVCQACRLARMNKIKQSHRLQHLLSTKSVRYRVENSNPCEKNWYPPSHKPLVTSRITHRGSRINPRSRRCDPMPWLLCQPNPWTLTGNPQYDLAHHLDWPLPKMRNRPIHPPVF